MNALRTAAGRSAVNSKHAANVILPKLQSGSMEGVDSSDPLPLAVAILSRASCESINPARFMQNLRDMWGGDARDAPSSIAFLRAYPTVFALDVEHRSYTSRGNTAPSSVTNNNYFAVDAVRLTMAATARAQASAEAALFRSKSLSLPPRLPPGAWPPAAAALLSHFDASLLPRTTSRPPPKIWAPLLERILRERGDGSTFRVSVHDLLAAVHAEAFAANLPFPPHAVAWFALSSEPLYARIRAVWSEEIELSLDGGGGVGVGVGKTIGGSTGSNNNNIPKHIRRAALMLAQSGENKIPKSQLEHTLSVAREAAAAAVVATTTTTATCSLSPLQKRMSSVMVAVELLPITGQTALEKDIEMLHTLAAEPESVTTT